MTLPFGTLIVLTIVAMASFLAGVVLGSASAENRLLRELLKKDLTKKPDR